MSIPEALKGAQLELSQTPGALNKLRLCGAFARIFGQELLGTLRVLPYGIRALRLHSSLPHPADVAAGRAAGVSLARDQRYGELQRNTLDVYVPPPTALAAAAEGRPVAIFCHGGVWSTGEKWHYSPLATRLAQEGIVTCVPQYTLYPRALAPQMAAEVGASLSWAQRHAAEFGGSASRISVVGHSAGAHLWLMALLHRAAAMPAAFVGMAGAYDIRRHYAYEQGRGVASLSTMARVVGGQPGFASQSPALILARSAGSGSSAPPGRQGGAKQPQLRGQPVSLVETGFVYSPAPAEAQPPEAPAAPVLTRAQLARLPPTFLMSSSEDITVPWEQSLLLQSALEKCGCAVTHRRYPGAEHADFAINWQARLLASRLDTRNCGSAARAEPLVVAALLQAPERGRTPDFAADLISIIREAGE